MQFLVRKVCKRSSVDCNPGTRGLDTVNMSEKFGDVIFKKDRDFGNEDIWDDSALIKAYDEAVNVMQEKLVERGIDSGITSSNTRTKKKKKKKSKTTSKRAPNSRNHLQWKVGEHCRAVYTEDGEIYEAVILSIDAEKSAQSDSKEGKYPEGSSRIMHPHDSEAFTESESGADWEHAHNSPYTPRRRGQGYRKHHSVSHDSDHDFSFMPPPPSGYMPPPFSLPPFMAGPSVPFGPHPSHRSMFSAPDLTGSHGCPKIPPPPPLDDLDVVENDKEALHSMLISWYMSGYHTGYYQGLKAGKMSKSKDKQRKETRN